jgi:N-glycosylase/DNA lyase
VQTPHPFDLDLTVRSHGFYDLPPWRYDAERGALGRPLRLAQGRTVFAEVAGAPGGLSVRVLAEGRLAPQESREAREAMRACLALDEELAPFQAPARDVEARRAAGGGAARDLPDLRWALARGAGRLLRSPTVFEDAVKTLCTTNCSWALTRAMVTRLCDLLGRHDHLALDSWTRAKLARLHGRRRVPSDRTLRRWFAPYGPWAGLAMWLDVTADWHGDRPGWP